MKRKATLATSGFAHFVHDGFTDSMYVLFPLWAEAFGLSLSQVGFLKMCSSGGLASFQSPASLLAERFGERAVLATGTVVAGACFALLGLASGFAALAVILIAFGAGCGTQHPLASSVVSRAYHSGGRRAAIGAYNFSGDLGKVAVPASVAASAVAIGWRESTIAFGIICVAAGIVIFLLLRRFGAGGPPLARAESKLISGPKSKGWGLRDRRGFALLSVISMIDSGARLAFLTFMPFLLIDKGAAVEVVGFALVLVFAGGAAGKLLCGLIAERAGVIRTTILTEMATAGFIVLLITLPLMPALFLLPVFGVVLNGTASVLYGTVGDFVDLDHQSRAFGLFYTLSVGSGALAPVAFGVLSDLSNLETTLTTLAAMVLTSVPLCWLLRPSLAAVDVERA